MRVVGLLLLACSTAAAQTPHVDRALQLAIDNDLIAIRGAGRPPDYDYTHGTRVAVAWPSAPRWVARLVGNRPDCSHAVTRASACMTSALELGQEIYTPRRDAAEPIRGERPYAGWLYSSALARVVAPGYTRFLRLTVGVTGPPALAAEVQGCTVCYTMSRSLAGHTSCHSAPGWRSHLAPATVVSDRSAMRVPLGSGWAGAQLLAPCAGACMSGRCETRVASGSSLVADGQ